MIEFEEALSLIINNTHRLPVERVLVEDSIGRVLMEDVYSNIEMPPFNKSAMDGYAVKAEDIKRAPVKLRFIGSIQAGKGLKKRVMCGECAKIMTGAPLPEGADSVVMIEETQQYGKNIEILRSVKRWQNVCFQGEDVKKGQRVLEKGKIISISDIGVLATIGRRYVKSIRRPDVAVLNTGGEIVPLGCKLSRRSIYNSNGPQLLSLLKSVQINPRFLGIVKDEPRELTRVIKRGLEGDMLLISGGVSMGDYDLVPGILKDLGVKEIFHKVNIKPGKPLFFGKRKNTIVFGIPGNPVSNFLTHLIFIQPALCKMMGRESCKPLFEEGILKKTFYQKKGRRHFVLVKISNSDSCYRLDPVKSHGSADTLALSRADGFMIVDGDRHLVDENSKMRFITWRKIEGLTI